MYIAVFGLNHNTAPLEIREKVFVSDTDTPHFLKELRSFGISEAVIISTCNRTEIFFCSDKLEESFKTIKEILSRYFIIEQESLNNYTYVFTDENAYRHLFLVTSGLDSMVIGEAQIFGQVKDAYRASALHNSTNFFLNKVFHRAFHVAKRVRTETKIGYNPVSISSMAVELSKKIFGELSKKRILVIGAGEMCEIALKYFKKEGLSEISIINRTFQNAQRLSEDIMGIPYHFSKLSELLIGTDMVISSTGSEKPIIDTELVTMIMRKRKNKPLFFIDIAVPRDIDAKVNHIENVYLYNIDDLRELSQKHLVDRIKESEAASAIIEEEVAKFTRWLEQLDMNPLITHIFDKTEEIRRKELKKALQKMKMNDKEAEKNIDFLTKTIVNKIIHPHIEIIKQDGSPAVMDTIKKIFKFEDENDNEEKMDNRDDDLLINYLFFASEKIPKLLLFWILILILLIL